MNTKEKEIYDYFDIKLNELAEANRLLGLEARKLEKRFKEINEKLYENNTQMKEYINIQRKLEQN